mmetsp:Transcript_50201/g.155147  ORF Transcript_50201/g.155147 Transcript_50201/m.155147 type:complete len:223 (+) Transcript_50201:946-1614(+)
MLAGVVCQSDGRGADESAILDRHLRAARWPRPDGIHELVRAAAGNLQVRLQTAKGSCVSKGHDRRQQPHGSPDLRCHDVGRQAGKPGVGATRLPVGRPPHIKPHVDVSGDDLRQPWKMAPLKQADKLVEGATALHATHEAKLSSGIPTERDVREKLSDALGVETKALLPPRPEEIPAELRGPRRPRCPDERVRGVRRSTGPGRAWVQLCRPAAETLREGRPP